MFIKLVNKKIHKKNFIRDFGDPLIGTPSKNYTLKIVSLWCMRILRKKGVEMFWHTIYVDHLQTCI